METYGIGFDFDCEDDPPRVFICDNQGSGTCYVQVLEEPILKAEKWSWLPEDWEPGPLARKICEFMNKDEH